MRMNRPLIAWICVAPPVFLDCPCCLCCHLLCFSCSSCCFFCCSASPYNWNGLFGSSAFEGGLQLCMPSDISALEMQKSSSSEWHWSKFGPVLQSANGFALCVFHKINSISWMTSNGKWITKWIIKMKHATYFGRQWIQVQGSLTFVIRAMALIYPQKCALSPLQVERWRSFADQFHFHHWMYRKSYQACVHQEIWGERSRCIDLLFHHSGN